MPYYNKPPLKIWLSALTISLFGDSEFVLRIWDAVFGLLTFIMVYFLGRVLFSSSDRFTGSVDFDGGTRFSAEP